MEFECLADFSTVLNTYQEFDFSFELTYEVKDTPRLPFCALNKDYVEKMIKNLRHREHFLPLQSYLD